MAAGLAPQGLVLADLWNGGILFLKQETQKRSFGGGSDGSHPLGCVKARGGGGTVRRRSRLSVPLYLTWPWLRAQPREETEWVKVEKGSGEKD